ncbi:MAG: amidohydrolase/deacetylase family metallohydrolase [Candidatus Latescibacteria bacterium]|jgi:dihydroorotase|nr:amidohydrolase/deacetylase family metallohydrolase [Candidatus Latescibacterota bacterium]MBT4140280.1 amidohydrolase/deacetylase family metallohydrolase [Candidatus Latescibacterota bacterium]MBT5828552.1 amidohydrolase/deacetylase family metallohydrolase [Candidatus Latescibacterota bacterium]
MSDQKLDLVLKGARVIDPANSLNGVLDVGILNGKIARVEADILAEDAGHVIDVTGLLVTPGLIDIHIHAYFTRQLGEGLFSASLNPDAHFPASGVTTCVDTGTAGYKEIAHFRETVMEKAKTRVLAYVNISAPGMGAPEQDIRTFDTDGASGAAKEHADVVVGIKTAHYWTSLPFDDLHPAWESVEKSVEAGNKCDMPVMVDFWPRPPVRSYSELILEKLRPGDIHTHVYARQFPVVDDDGNVEPYMFKARERGIWFDLGHGAASFWYRNGARAIANGFGPDSISTDLHMGNIIGPVFSMQDTMSKCMAMGMSLEDVIYRSTVTPAQAIHRPELGTLSIGAEADVAVLDLQKGLFPLQDCGYTRIDAQERLKCRLTLRAGKIIYDRDARTVPKWEDARPEYWPVTLVPQGVPRLWNT